MQDILLFAQKHSTLSIALIVVVVFLMILEFMRSRNMPSIVSLGRATLMINHERAVVIDLRSTDLFKSGHIVDAISMPVDTIEVQMAKLNKYKSQPIILYCAQGAESSRIAQILLKQQFNVSVLKGGLRAWKEASMPLVKG